MRRRAVFQLTVGWVKLGGLAGVDGGVIGCANAFNQPKHAMGEHFARRGGFDGGSGASPASLQSRFTKGGKQIRLVMVWKSPNGGFQP